MIRKQLFDWRVYDESQGFKTFQYRFWGIVKYPAIILAVLSGFILLVPYGLYCLISLPLKYNPKTGQFREDLRDSIEYGFSSVIYFIQIPYIKWANLTRYRHQKAWYKMMPKETYIQINKINLSEN